MPDPSFSRHCRILAAPLAALAALGGCSGSTAPPQGGPVAVGFVTVQPASSDLTSELPGRTTPLRSGEVRPQVSGVILRQLFTEGAVVHAGQPLYTIDPALYRAAVRQAEANLASAESRAHSAGIKADRYRPLAADQAVAQQDYTDAASAAHEAVAAVAQARAALDTARINLRYTTVPAPVSGRIGRSLVPVGGLATAGQTQPLAVISVLDPIYVDIQQSAADMMALRQSFLADGGTAPMHAPVALLLDNGNVYSQPGTLEFSEVTADPATGTVAMRARFPNPQGLLLPGMFVRARLTLARQTAVFLVPQPAVLRDARGQAEVFVVGADNRAMLRPVTAPRMQGGNWVVTAGLKPGERVVTQGTGRLKPGSAVKPTPADTAQAPLPPTPKG